MVSDSDFWIRIADSDQYQIYQPKLNIPYDVILFYTS